MPSSRTIAALTLVSLAGGCADYEVLWVDGARRQYLDHVPSGEAPDGGFPLVLVYHGAYSTPTQMEGYTDLNAVADEGGFVVAYPKGKLRLWNDGRIADLADDVGFTDALIDEMIDRHDIDPDRVYATGISNGAFMTHRLACDLGDRIAAIAPVAGSLSEELLAQCESAHAMPVLSFMGTDDDLVPYEGGELGGDLADGRFGTMLSAEDTTAFWADVAGCDDHPEEVEVNEEEDGTRLRTRTYQHCEAGAEVVLQTVVGGGHTWPGARHVTGLGTVTQEIDASAAIWSFFAHHRLGQVDRKPSDGKGPGTGRAPGG